MNIKSYTHWSVFNFKCIRDSLNLRGLIKHRLINSDSEQTLPVDKKKKKNLNRSSLFHKTISENILFFMYNKVFFSQTCDISIGYRGNYVALELFSST